MASAEELVGYIQALKLTISMAKKMTKRTHNKKMIERLEEVKKDAEERLAILKGK